MTESAGKLQVDDEDFLVASLIDRCPKVMMLRELVKNAVEAASLTAGGQGNVSIGVVDISGVQKLAIRNTGPGMDAGKLHSMCNLAASFGKTKGLKGNFGMGAKVASLGANPLGVRYHSCAGGRVHEVTIGKYAGLYSRLQRTVPGGVGRADILDVSAAYPAEARATDWTEVVLFGRRAGQDTAVDPYRRRSDHAEFLDPGSALPSLLPHSRQRRDPAPGRHSLAPGYATFPVSLGAFRHGLRVGGVRADQGRRDHPLSL